MMNLKCVYSQINCFINGTCFQFYRLIITKQWTNGLSCGNLNKEDNEFDIEYLKLLN